MTGTVRDGLSPALDEGPIDGPRPKAQCLG